MADVWQWISRIWTNNRLVPFERQADHWTPTILIDSCLVIVLDALQFFLKFTFPGCGLILLFPESFKSLSFTLTITNAFLEEAYNHNHDCLPCQPQSIQGLSPSNKLTDFYVATSDDAGYYSPPPHEVVQLVLELKSFCLPCCTVEGTPLFLDQTFV